MATSGVQRPVADDGGSMLWPGAAPAVSGAGGTTTGLSTIISAPGPSPIVDESMLTGDPMVGSTTLCMPLEELGRASVFS